MPTTEWTPPLLIGLVHWQLCFASIVAQSGRGCCRPPLTPPKLAEAQCRGAFSMDNTFGLVTVHEIEPCMARRGYLAAR
jgi:hypothetical protein